MEPLSRVLGPLLILDHLADEQMHLAAIFVCPPGKTPAAIEVGGQTRTPQPLLEYRTATVFRARFTVPADAPSHYVWDGTRYDLSSDLSGDLSIAYASCNGEEHGDLDRDEAERNVMWARMAAAHAQTPFNLLLNGGDQIYADEATKGHPLSDDWPNHLPKDPSAHDLDDLRSYLRERFLRHYTAQLQHRDYAWLVARVPQMSQWDDHDICDGWGSLQRSRTYSPVGQVLFKVARETALALQHGCKDGDLPPRFADPEGYHLNWAVQAPGLRLLAPDLRSERTRRQVMADGGWADVERHADTPFKGRTLILSSVPLLGPRLSVLEAVMIGIPKMQEYEDDLRDQWQSRAHRASWQRMLRAVLKMHEAKDQAVTVLSGEIHLATRAEMAAAGAPLQQLVASGITHRAPPAAWARALGAFSVLGEAPLPDHPIRIRRVPGQAHRYIAQRNYLTLSRVGAAWSARWVFEHGGPSPSHPL